jgi:hypothetical protein
MRIRTRLCCGGPDPNENDENLQHRHTDHGSRERLHGSRESLYGSRESLNVSRESLHGSRKSLHGSRKSLHGSRVSGSVADPRYGNAHPRITFIQIWIRLFTLMRIWTRLF